MRIIKPGNMLLILLRKGERSAVTDWFYEGRQGGQRLGPFSEEKLVSLIREGEIDTATLVWNASMSSWEKVTSTTLAQHFTLSPPPLPLTALTNWPAYTLAVAPFLFWLMQPWITFALPTLMQSDGRSSIFSFLVFVFINTTLANVDTKSLLQSGVALRGGWLWAVIFVPAYLFVRGTSIRRVYGTNHLQTFHLVYIYAAVLFITLSFN